MRAPLAFFRRHVLPAVACFGAAWWLAGTGLIERVENLTLDERTKLRARWSPAVASDALALVGIDEASLRDFSRWPWPRDVHGDFLQLLGQRKPGVVGWDILFTEPSPEDAHFALGMRRAGAPVVIGTMLADEDVGTKADATTAAAAGLVPLARVEGDRSRIPGGPALLPPAGPLAGEAQAGFVDTPPEEDGVRRTIPLIVRAGGEVYPSFALRCLMEHWRARPEDVTVRLGEAVEIAAPLARRRIPIDEAGRYRINYRHRTEDFTVYGYSQAYAELRRRHETGAGPVPAVTGRIVIVGQVAEGLTDFGPTPFAPLTALVLVHANAIDNILNEDYARRAPMVPIWLGWLVIGVVGLASFSERRLWAQAAFGLGVPVAYAVAAVSVWVGSSVEVPMVGPLIGFGALQIFMIGRRVVSEQRAKERIKRMFGSYLAPQVVARMAESREMPRLGGHEAEITAYFSDIEGFSAFAEALPPERLVELMNEYLTASTDIVHEEGGTLDKYIGDAVVAMFGAPMALPDHAYRACVAAWRTQERLGELRRKWTVEGWPEPVQRMRTRIGLNTGPAVIGNMGSRTRFNYTMMGDNVNLAARMESGAKAWGALTVCTEATRRACEAHGGDRVVFRPLGRVRVQGRTGVTLIHEIVGLRESVTARTLECVDVFSLGLEKFHGRDWAAARELFMRSEALETEVAVLASTPPNPSRAYLELVARYAAEPPPEGWDGVQLMKEK